MAPAKVWGPKPPVEKLPLAVRKDVRDKYESKKEEYEATIAELLGFPVTIGIDVNAVSTYADLSSANVGALLAGYVDGFIYALKSYTETYEDLGKEYFKNAVTESKLTVTVNERGDKADTIDADVKDGVFRVLFHFGKFGYNASWLNEPFVNAIDKAPAEGFALKAKFSIETDYNTKVEEVQQKIAEVLNLTDVVLDPNFEENYAALQKKSNPDWQRSFGNATLQYFEHGILNQLSNQGFKDDDMLQEGFAEAVTSKTFKLRIADKTKSGSSNETILEDGVVYIQTTIDRWWSNVYEAGSGLIDLL